MSGLRLLTAGEAALVVEFGNAIDPALNARVRAFDRALLREPFEGFRESIPTYRSLLVFFDPVALEPSARARHLERLASAEIPREEAPAPLRDVPTVYDGEDLERVARGHGISREEVVRLHSECEVSVFMLGFVPGFAYLGLVPEAIATPRLPTPRTRVPAGAVAIAGRQTGIYPASTPGGWNLIGRTSVRLFDPDREEPSYLQSGDRVRFAPVDEAPPYTPWQAGPFRPAGAALFEVLDAGLLTTVQDIGRPGYQRLGVPVAGAIDPEALRTANRLVGNPEEDAGLECTVTGPTLRILRPVVLSVTGADFEPVLERADLGRWKVPLYTSFFARPGNVLSFDGRASGCRAYVAVAGGIDVPPILGSRSTYLMSGLGGFLGRALVPGDVIHCCHDGRGVAGQRSAAPQLTGRARVVLGPQDDYFGPEAIRALFESEFTIAPSSDRMGSRLLGPSLVHKGATEIVSDGMFAGAIQVPPDGKPIVMLADRATTGGYPKIGTVIETDLAQVGQLAPGEKLRFVEVSLEEATEIARRSTLRA